MISADEPSSERSVSDYNQDLLPAIMMKNANHREAIFGTLQITENPNEDLLTDNERSVYSSGFVTYATLVESVDSDIEKVVLLQTSVAAAIIGLSPSTSVRPFEANILLQELHKLSPSEAENFVFLRSSENQDIFTLLNVKAVEMILHAHASDIFHLDVPDRPLQRDEVVSYYIDIFKTDNFRQNTIAEGLFSGFPLEDCLTYSYPDENQHDYEIALPEEIEKATKLLVREDLAGQEMSFLRMYYNLLPKDEEVPSTRESISGYGLSWRADKPAGEATVKFCQKLLQVDRELGLTEFINDAHDSFPFIQTILKVPSYFDMKG